MVAVLVVEAGAAVVVGSSWLDRGSEKVVLLSAAGAGLLWAWVHLVRPLGRRVRSLFRSAEAFEHLPEWMATIEAEVGKVIAGQKRMENRQRAFNRDMGIKARGETAVDEFDVADGERGPSAPE